MANKIYTKTGDKGKTALFGGARISKDDVRIEAYGTVDELNAFVGHLTDQVESTSLKEFMFRLQSVLFNIGSILATDPQKPELKMQFDEQFTLLIEAEIDRMQLELEPLKNFILPSGHPIVSFCHMVRTVCRRAERRAVSLSNVADIDQSVLIFLNRLSDYFFVLSRYLAKQQGVEEVKWRS